MRLIDRDSLLTKVNEYIDKCGGDKNILHLIEAEPLKEIDTPKGALAYIGMVTKLKHEAPNHEEALYYKGIIHGMTACMDFIREEMRK